MDGAAPQRTPVVDQVFGQNKAPLNDVLDGDFVDLRREVSAMAARFANLPDAIYTEADMLNVGGAIKDARALMRKIDGIREVEKAPILTLSRALDDFFKRELPDDLPTLMDRQQRAADDFARRVEAQRRAEAERIAREAREREAAERAKAEAAATAQTAGRAEARAEAAATKAEQAEADAAASTTDLTRMRGAGVSVSAKGVWSARIDDYRAAVAPLGALGPFLENAAVQKALNSMARIHKDAAAWPGVVFLQSAKAQFR